MTPEQRSKLIRRLCLFAPLLSAASITLLTFAPVRGLFLQTSQKLSPGLASFVGVAPVLGWFVLALGCSAVTALDLVQRRERSAASLVLRSVFGTVLVFFTHLLVISIIAFAGCGIVLGFGY
jgi:hypothetical protein